MNSLKFSFPLKEITSDSKRNAFHFTTLLEEIEIGAIKGQVFDFSTESSTEVVFSLGDVLQFVTASPSIPAVGFQPRPVIAFNHLDASRKLQANTCANLFSSNIFSD